MSIPTNELAPILAAIRENGYAVLKNLGPVELMDEIRTELAPWLQCNLMGRNDFEGHCTERVYALLAKAPAIARLIEHPSIIALLDELLPPHYLLSAALAINVHPGETAQRWHRDDTAGGFMKDMPRPHLGVSIIWALDDFTEENGATQIAPGSHQWETGREPADGEFVTAVMPKGSALVFLGNTLHRGGANNSENDIRLAITPQYCMPYMRPIETMTLAVPPRVAGQYSDRVQELLGYSIIEPGFMGYVDGVHPKKLIKAAT